MTEDLQKVIAELQAEYLEQLPRRLKELQLQFSGHEWEELQNSFHKLKGTGKTYGIPEISEVCYHMEWLSEHHPDLMSRNFSLAIELLQDIYAAKCSKLDFDLNNDERFHRIQQIAVKAGA